MVRATILLAIAVTALAASPAIAQTDPPACAPYRAKWDSVASGSNVAAMDGVIRVIPSLCPALSSDAKARRASLAREIDARLPPPPPPDPCQRARNDWQYIQNGSEATLRAYRDGLPAVCAVWRSQAQERLNQIENQRIAAQQQAARQAAEAQRIAGITAAAKATGIEGRWMVPDVPCPRDLSTMKVLSIVDGAIVYTDPAPAREEWRVMRYPIRRVDGNIVTEEQSGTQYIVSGDTKTMAHNGVPDKTSFAVTRRCSR